MVRAVQEMGVKEDGFYRGEVGGAENAECCLGFWILDCGFRVWEDRVHGLGGPMHPDWLFPLYLVVAGQRADTWVRPYTVMVVGW